ncbi:hypothetical protein MXB_4640 [Myxobolus squamalis]|nr:hypothetical protein MXB_4640 [Myxobolus squamalis]
MVPVYTSCHVCESKRLWKQVRASIRQRNDENFKISVITAYNQLEQCEFDTRKEIIDIQENHGNLIQ